MCCGFPRSFPSPPLASSCLKAFEEEEPPRARGLALRRVQGMGFVRPPPPHLRLPVLFAPSVQGGPAPHACPPSPRPSSTCPTCRQCLACGALCVLVGAWGPGDGGAAGRWFGLGVRRRPLSTRHALLSPLPPPPRRPLVVPLTLPRSPPHRAVRCVGRMVQRVGGFVGVFLGL